MRRAVLLALALGAGCGAPAAPHAPPAAKGDPLEEVARVHGGAGPWAVLGYRMGAFALARLGLARLDFDLEVVHASPDEVQYSCIADGAAAATGASLGKLNLRLIPAPAAGVRTVFRHKPTGREIVLEPSDAFRARFRDVPREKLAEAGRVVLGLPDAELFRVLSAPP